MRYSWTNEREFQTRQYFCVVSFSKALCTTCASPLISIYIVYKKYILIAKICNIMRKKVNKEIKSGVENEKPFCHFIKLEVSNTKEETYLDMTGA